MMIVTELLQANYSLLFQAYEAEDYSLYKLIR